MGAVDQGRGRQVSLIVTIRNDREGLNELLGALSDQTEMPDEIVVVDGGSHDGTLDELDHWDEKLAPLRLVVAPGANIAAGRNIAVREARYDWILCTDAGCRPLPGWLAALRRADEEADIAAGTFVVEGDSAFERALACTHYPMLEELHETDRLVELSHRLFGREFRSDHAGGRSMAFSRAAWEAAGGFPEHVYAGEDLAFTAAAIERGFHGVLVESATVRWRPRLTWTDNARMFATYARGDIRTKGRARHRARLAAWTLGPVVAVRGGRKGKLLAATGALAYIWLPLRRARRAGLRWRDLWLIPALVGVKDLSQLLGAAIGIVDGIRGVPQPAPRRHSFRRSG